MNVCCLQKEVEKEKDLLAAAKKQAADAAAAARVAESAARAAEAKLKGQAGLETLKVLGCVGVEYVSAMFGLWRLALEGQGSPGACLGAAVPPAPPRLPPDALPLSPVCPPALQSPLGIAAASGWALAGAVALLKRNDPSGVSGSTQQGGQQQSDYCRSGLPQVAAAAVQPLILPYLTCPTLCSLLNFPCLWFPPSAD